MTNRSIKEILKASRSNLWANKVLVILALLLVAALLATSNATGTSRGITVVAIMAILTKAESRPQPISVAIVAATLSILSAVGMMQVPNAKLCGWIAAFLILPLVFSKQIAMAAKESPLTRKP